MNIERALLRFRRWTAAGLVLLAAAPSWAAFTDVCVRTDSEEPGTCRTSVTLSPDNDGVNDAAVVSATPPQTEPYWAGEIATDSGFTDVIRYFCGECDDNQFTWDGRGHGEYNGQVVPNGTYYVRLRTYSGTVDGTLSVTVESPYIRGRILDDDTGNPIEDVQISANSPGYFGPGGFANTDQNGNFTITGLQPDRRYTLEIRKTGYAQERLEDVEVYRDIGDVRLEAGANVSVNVTVTGGAPTDDLFGNVGLYNEDGYNFGFLRLAAGQTDSDDGQYPTPGSRTVVSVEPDQQYRLEVYLPGYGRFTREVTAPGAGETLNEDFELARRANISGTVTLPGPLDSPYGGTWVSIEAIPDGDSNGFAVAWGGVFITDGQTTATYQVEGIDPGTYRLRTWSNGFKSVRTDPITVGASSVTGPDIALSVGGKIVGNITVTGDTTQVSDTSGFYGSGGGCGSNQFSIFVNAWNPESFNGAGTAVCLEKASVQTSGQYELTGLDDGTFYFFSYLPSFQSDPVMPVRVNVENGAGRLDMAFRAFSGTLRVRLNLDSGDYGNVEYKLNSRSFGQDFDSNEGTFTGPSIDIGQLGTGLYELEVLDRSTGLLKTLPVSVTNGNVTEVTVDMNDRTYSVSGTLSITSPGITLSSPYSGTVTTLNALRSATAGGNEGEAPEIQVFSFPLPERFHGNIKPLRDAHVGEGLDADTGEFTITGLVNGVYLLRVNEDINPVVDTNCPDCESEGQPEFASSDHVIAVQDGSVSGVAITLTNGATLSGTISRPSGDSDSAAHPLEVSVRRTDGLVVNKTTCSLTGNSTSYTMRHLAAGDYIVAVRDEFEVENSTDIVYVAQPKVVTVAGTASVTQDITLIKGGFVVGKIRDADSNTLITSKNYNKFIPDNFGVFANANPWKAGGHAEADRSQSGGGGGRIKISTGSATTGEYFTISRLVPGTSYDVTMRGFDGFGARQEAQGQKAYATAVKSGIQISEAQTTDIGVIDLKQGVNISGQVTDAATGRPLPNVAVVAYPSQTDGGDRHDLGVQGYTDSEGLYVLRGIDRDREYYDVQAAPRFETDDVFANLSGTKYGTETVQLVNVQDSASRASINFALTEANAVVKGKVKTVDGGELSDPFGDKSAKFRPRRARIVLHEDGAPLGDDPLGEIEASSDFQGNFRVDALKPGSYTMRVISVGYVTSKKILVLSTGDNDAGTITLEKGATVKGTIAKPDGSSPSTGEMDGLVGVDADFDEFVFGRLESDSATGGVTGYELSGFKTGVEYSIIAFSKSDDLVELKTGLRFSSNDETKTLNLIYRPSAPAVFVTQSRSGNRYTLRFFSTQKLRNLTGGDNDMRDVASLTQGAGTIVSRTLHSSRDTITVVYDAPANERTFKIQIAFTSIVQNPDDAAGGNFTFSQEFKFFAGASRMRLVRIPNAIGGNAALQGDPTGGSFGSGTFDVGRSQRVEVGVVSVDSLDDIGTAPRAAPSPAARAQSVASTARSLGPEAYPAPEVYEAVRMAPAVNPFSAFYDIFLPAGVSHSLKKEALLTLKYDDSVTDTSKINIYYYEPNSGTFLLESSKRKVDAKNKTITVGVSHASTFVVLNSNQTVVGSNTYTGTEIFLSNFPNPFNLKSKTVSLSNAPSSPTQTIEGTMIKYALPAGKSGAVKLEIFNVAGELVRTISETASTGGTYYYTAWDGKNDGGKAVASGVYIARFTLNGGDEKFFKMAVLK
jgi:flagellar hook assembly protein FlgD